MNTLALRFPAPPGSATGVLGGSLRLPPAPLPAAGLEMLPEPVLSDPGGLLVTLARLDDGVLSAALRTLAALGGRGGSVESPRVVEASAFNLRTLGSASLIVIGGSGGNAQLERLRRQLPAPQEAGPIGDGAAAFLAVQALPGQPAASRVPHFQLWLDGSSPLLLQAAAGALDRHPLPGSAVRLDATGRPQALPTPVVSQKPASQPPQALLQMLLAALGVTAVATTLLVLGWQVRKPLEAAW
jgi:hypothetical protein